MAKDNKTNAMRILDKMKIKYERNSYECDEFIDGIHIADKLGQDYDISFKTIVTEGKSEGFYVFVLPVDKEIDLKKAARSVGEKNLALIHVKDVNKVTGYIRGGCTPVGMKKQYPTVIHESAKDHDTIIVSGGKIGEQIMLAPDDLLKVCNGRYADIVMNSDNDDDEENAQTYDKKNIRLIVTDVDGTLVPEGTRHPSEETMQTIEELIDSGIVFAFASGRAYESIRRTFPQFIDKAIYIPNNGACVKKNDETIKMNRLDDELVKEIITYIRNVPTRDFMVTTDECSYTESTNKEFIDWLVDGYGYNLKYCRDIINDMHEPVMKIAMLLNDVDALTASNEAKKHFGDRVAIMGAGDHWVDFIGSDVDKGNAVNELQGRLGISPDETMTFGDNLNDIGLILSASYGYAVAGARDELKEVAYEVLPDRPDAVIRKMREAL